MTNDNASNPLLAFSSLPRFDLIRPEHVQPAVDTLLAQASAALEKVVQPDFPARWLEISRVLDVATEKLERAWAAVSHLNAVMDTPELRAAYNAALPAVVEFWTRLGSDGRLYAKYKSMDVTHLTPEQRSAHSHAMRDFVLGGAELQGETKTRFAQIQEELATASQKFSENTLDATDSFAYCATREELEGVPEDVIQAARALAQEEGSEGFRLTLKMPCYLPVMQFARSSALRERLYRAWVTRASDQAPANAQRFDNTALMQKILALRAEEATLLGYPDYGHLSLVPKMANSPEQVTTFLLDLAQRARSHALQDVADMREYAARHDMPGPHAWDWTHIAQMLKQERYDYSEQEVRQYFPLPAVLAGLFSIVQTLFSIRLEKTHAPVWHPDVQFYRIEQDCGDASCELVGRLYLDLFARPGKRSGAWMNDVRSRWLRPDTGKIQAPIAHIVCNFASGVDGRPPLLSHDDVITLFHETGHALHHLLTRVNERDVAGINGVEWDAVELPSQFMENFCWDRDVIRRMSAHVDTGKPIPQDLFDRMLAARNFQSGLAMLRQIEFALFDMRLHTAAQSRPDIQALLQQVRSEVAVLPAPEFSRMAHTFSHIFAGGYAAGYYSYKWAEVLSADAFAAFEETMRDDGTFDPQTGTKYRQAILETGASRPALESFRAFRGREPQIDALLRHNGL